MFAAFDKTTPVYDGCWIIEYKPEVFKRFGFVRWNVKSFPSSLNARSLIEQNTMIVLKHRELYGDQVNSDGARLSALGQMRFGGDGKNRIKMQWNTQQVMSE